MKKVVIIGCGFSGMAALSKLKRSGLRLDISVIDKKRTFDFLPALPDCLGRGIHPEDLTFDIEKFAPGFINEEVVSLDLEKKEAATVNRTLAYDYLLIASGSETNFYGNDQIKKYALTLDSAADAGKIIAALKQNVPPALTIPAKPSNDVIFRPF